MTPDRLGAAMVAYRDEGTVPLTQEQLWKFLDLHLSDTEVLRIHSDIRTQRTMSREGNVQVVERGIRFFGKTRRSVWKLTYERPGRSRWEILEGEGPMAKGSFLDNSYSEVPGGVLVRSEGSITVAKFPAFLQPRVVRAALDHITEQDIEYLRDHPM